MYKEKLACQGYLAETKQALLSIRFCLAIIGTFMALAIASWDSFFDIANQRFIIEKGSHNSFFLAAAKNDWFLLLSPVLCTLPYTSSFADEAKSGNIKFSLIRTNKKSYIANKVSAVIISGGLSLLIGAMLFFVCSASALFPLETVNASYKTMAFVDIGGKLITLFLFGSLFSLIGALASSLLLSAYVGYILPFVGCYFLIILCERYFKSIYVINPKEWIIMDNFWPLGSFGVDLLILGIIIFTSILFSMALYKKIKVL